MLNGKIAVRNKLFSSVISKDPNKEKDLELIANSNSGLSRMVTEKNKQVEILNIALKLACEDLFFTKFPYLNKEDNPSHEFNGLLNHYKNKAKELLNESNND